MAKVTVGSYVFDNGKDEINNAYSSAELTAGKTIYDVVGTNTFDFTGLSFKSVDLLGNWLIAKDANGGLLQVALNDNSVLNVGTASYGLKTMANFKATVVPASSNNETPNPAAKTIDLATVSTPQGDKATVETFKFAKGAGVDKVTLSNGDKLSVGTIKVIDKAITAVPTDTATQTYALYTPATDTTSATLAIVDKISKNPLTKKVTVTASKTDVVTLSSEADVKLVGLDAAAFDKGFVMHG